MEEQIKEEKIAKIKDSNNNSFL